MSLIHLKQLNQLTHTHTLSSIKRWMVCHRYASAENYSINIHLEHSHDAQRYTRYTVVSSSSSPSSYNRNIKHHLRNATILSLSKVPTLMEYSMPEMQIGQEVHTTRIWYVKYSKLYHQNMLKWENYNTGISL